MKKAMTLDEMEERFKKSITGDTRIFEEFLIDYADRTPQHAYEKLLGEQPADDIKKCAQDFIEDSFTSVLKDIMERANNMPTQPTTHQNKVLQDFYRDLFMKGDFNLAWENAQAQINADDTTRTDLQFRRFMRDEAEKVKPQEKHVRDHSLQEDEGAFIKFRQGLKERISLKPSNFELKGLMEKSLSQFYKSRMTGGTLEPNISHEMELVYKHKELPLALKLAVQDTQKITTLAVSEIGELKGSFKSAKDYLGQGVKFNQKENVISDLANNGPFKSIAPCGTENMEIIRNLIINLEHLTVPDAFAKALEATPKGEFKMTALLEEYQPKITGQNVTSTRANMLLDGYRLYIDVNSKVKDIDVLLEAAELTKGKKSEVVRAAIKEITDKSASYLVAANINSGLKKLVHTKTKDRVKKERVSAIIDIAKRTDLEISLDNALGQVINQDLNGNTPNLGPTLN